MDVEAVTAEAARPVRWPVLVQSWHDLAFVHWAVDPAVVAPLLPPGTRPDVLDGRTYVGLIGFRMVRLGPLAGPGLPYLGTFCETNVRLYSVDGAGRRAVVFRSLDASRLLPVLVARVGLGLPYMWSRMRLRRDGEVRTYTCRRRWPGPRGAASLLSVRVGPVLAEPSPLEHFLTARWGLHVHAHGRTLHMPNVHPRWPLHRAELLALDDELVLRAGLPAPGTEPVSVLYSPGVPVRFGAPTTVRVGGAGQADSPGARKR
ncbi:YqjF family protein [Micromonospora sp. CPCC 205561]|uniref:YqjF family protein n=1 Tax=Micromonospora sp. CPCC 205561 TaxID=3122407 RepID=UPI002FF1380F